MGSSSSAISPASSNMRGGINFTTYKLTHNEKVSSHGSLNDVIMFTFEVPQGMPLGLTQPCTHVKIRLPSGRLPKARTFSLMSEADQKGSFQICAKIQRGGRVTPWLASLPVGSPVPFTKTLTKRLAAPLHGPAAAGRRLGMVAYGVGVTECVLTAEHAAAAGQHVILLYAVRTVADALFLERLSSLAARFPPKAGSERDAADVGSTAGRQAGLFELHVVVSRETPPEDYLSSLLQSTGTTAVAEEGAQRVGEQGAGAMPVAMSGSTELRPALFMRQGRIDIPQLQAVFGGWSTARASTPASAVSTSAGTEGLASTRRAGQQAHAPPAFMVVGSKPQMRSTYAQLASLGHRQRLLGRPILWGCW